MFDTRWASRAIWSEQQRLPGYKQSNIRRDQVDKTLHLRWEEHCVECAFPSCYSTCALYTERADKNCARFAYGIYPNPDFRGHFSFGADILFRRWGKLEAALNGASASIPVVPHGILDLFTKLPLGLQNRLAILARREPLDFDEFVIELYSPASKPFRLILQYDVNEFGKQRIPYRDAFEVHEGLNLFTVPFERFALNRAEGFLRLFPENTADETRLVFTWLDFVKFKAPRGPAAVKMDPATRPASAEKVKCVAWDLDNTLWDGTLTEMSDPNSLTLRPGVNDLIKALDERGIIQTVVSKNDHSVALTQLERLGLADYFVYSAINWGQKSQNLRAIAERINIGIDTFALLDDSALQRNEVQTALPQVRVYPETSIPSLCDLPEFDVPITSASKKRRLSYLASMRREEVLASFDGGYEEFLLDCKMEICIFEPRDPIEVVRCWELLQRTNQLNLSGRRYSLDEFKELIKERKIRGFGIDYRDRFGNYGTVGFASLEQTPQSTLRDFVFSCRVAQQQVEHSFLRWLAETLRRAGADQLRAVMVKTDRNGALRKLFSDLSFEVVTESEKFCDLKLDLTRGNEGRSLASITSKVDGLI